MKITQVAISGMHKAQDKVYDLNPGVTYFVGENGAGKSTILEAIQLALLGYIPGYAKTKEGIIKHASGKFMEVNLTLDSGIVINRTWVKSGSGSVSSECNVTGFDGQISDLMKGIELPIFDFNEFTKLTANKLKEWFISFLPNSNKDFNLLTLLKDQLGTRQIASDNLLNEVDKWIQANSVNLKGVDLVKGLNSYLKEEQSFIKGQVSKLQSTVESLIYYDDAPSEDEDELNSKLSALNNEKTLVLKLLAQHDAWEKMKVQVKLLEASLKSNSYDADPRVTSINTEIDELLKKSNEYKEISNTLNKSISELEAELRNIPSANATCPYTNEFCQKASDLAEDANKKRDEVTSELAELKQKRDQYGLSVTMKIDSQIRELQGKLLTIQNEYSKLKMLNEQLGPEPDMSDSRNLESIDSEIKAVQEGLVKVAANRQYDQLTKTVTADKFAMENDLEVLKIWIKLTDANGLQTDMMDEPFKDLSSDMSKYLTQMFGVETTAQFNLATKANSFSFGLTRNGQYIEFDCLSSGERCLFTLALMMCILDRSESQLRVILIDDLLDHLDGSNADSMFKSLQSVDSIQFILAGVKECNEPSICKAV